MVRMILLAVGAFTAMLIGFSYLMGISKMDVSIKHQMQRHVVAEPFEAGDIIEVSPDGQRIVSVLCSFGLETDKRKKTEIKASYYNLVDYSRDRFVAFVQDAKGMFGIPVAAAPRDASRVSSLPFVGEVNRVVGSIESAMPQACICDIAKAVIESRSKACVVEKSLVETELSQSGGTSTIRKTVGISFRERPIFFNDLEPIKAICPGLNIAGTPPAEQSCIGQSGFSFDVVARSRIGLIRETQLE